MKTPNDPDLLIIGAGPAGLTTALQGARAGLSLRIIDQEWRISARSYACTLHPRTLDLLDDFGILPRLLDLGVRVDTVAFYESTERRAEVSLSALPSRHPFALVLYQDDLEGALEDALREQHGIRVEWGRRLEALQWDGPQVSAVIEQLQHSPTGDPQRQWQEVVDRRSIIPARFVVGADGPRSRLAHLLGTESDLVDDPLNFGIYEFEPLSDAGQEIRVAVQEGHLSTFWPLPGGTCRWSLPIAEPGSDANPDLAHESGTVLDAPVGSGGRRSLVQRIQHVAPWFQAGIHHLDWAMRLEFPRRLAHRFGRGPCWLIGDAAHQGWPAGAHSMNLAFLEATEWVEAVQTILRDNASADCLTHWNDRWQVTWRELLGLKPAVEALESATPWVRDHANNLMTSLPASGTDLVALLGQLGLRPSSVS